MTSTAPQEPQPVLVGRERYLSLLRAYEDRELVKVVTGVRRCGKSKLLELYRDDLLARGVPATSIAAVNFELSRFDDLRDPRAFRAWVWERLGGTDHGYLFVDEVQELAEWGRTVNDIRASRALDVVVTGSNARVFSGEHLTYLSGRYVELPMLPLSFAEYLGFREAAGLAPRERRADFDAYLRDGSFPAVALTDNGSLVDAIMSGLNDSIVRRDVMLRGAIRNEATFLRVLRFLYDNVGNQTSTNAIANTLRSQGHRASADAVDGYLKLMCDAHLFYLCERYDIRGRERLRTNGKYYVVDTGLRNHALGYRPSDLGHLVENLVYLHLRRAFDAVYVGKLPKGEVDFVAMRDGQPTYWQVSLTALDPAVLERETRPLLRIRDNYPKHLVTLDDVDLSAEGVVHHNLIDFLATDSW